MWRKKTAPETRGNSIGALASTGGTLDRSFEVGTGDDWPTCLRPVLRAKDLMAEWALLGLNQRPLACEASALPLS
jgi:hypothetical protein